MPTEQDPASQKLPPEKLAELHPTAAAKLLAGLADKGGRQGPAPDTVLLGFSDIQAKCVVFDVRPQPDGFGAAVGVEVSGPGLQKPIRDVSGARGATIDEAIEGAMQPWLAGLFIPLRDALGEQFAQYRYGITQTDNRTGESSDWCVYESPLHLGGEQEVHEKLWEKLKDPPIFGRLLQTGMLPPMTGEDVHWLKLAVMGQDAKTVRVECAFDGQPWKALDGVFQDFVWPGRGMQMFRQYWVLTSN